MERLVVRWGENKQLFGEGSLTKWPFEMSKKGECYLFLQGINLSPSQHSSHHQEFDMFINRGDRELN